MDAPTSVDPREDEERRRMLLTHLASGDDLLPDRFPELTNLSAGFMFRAMPRPREAASPEFVYVDERAKAQGSDDWVRQQLFISNWNVAWEADRLRHEMFRDVPPQLSWLTRLEGHNIYLLPKIGRTRYVAYQPLFHLIPKATLDRFGLPAFKRGVWPYMGMSDDPLDELPADFDDRLARAFAYHVWPALCSGSSPSAFSENDPIKLLGHNLDFWLPYATRVVEERLRDFPLVEIEDSRFRKRLEKVRRSLDSDLDIDSPRKGGTVWMGEDDAWDATREMIEMADSGGRLRGLLDAVRSNRVEEDFSPLWSHAREDFERKLYHKRAKVKVRFVELSDTIPVHGPESEVHENLLWEEFLALFDGKERQVVVLLRNGFTRVGDIARELGYANHSPVSKALARIRSRAKPFLN